MKRLGLALLLSFPLSLLAANITIAPQPLASALQAFSEQSGLQVGFVSRIAKDLHTQGARDARTPAEALNALLAGTTLEYRFVNAQTVVIREKGATKDTPVTMMHPSGSQNSAPMAIQLVRADEAAARQVMGAARKGETMAAAEWPAGEQTGKDVSEVTVVGSRLGGVPVESAMPVKVITRDDIERSGASNIAQVLSLLPEVSMNNSGDRPDSSRPGAIGGTGSTNSTTVQLRGLPLGSTLVLVNGRRVGSSSSFAGLQSESFFDLTNVPLSMVERIEVLPYGASAVYGGDGLAGVVNIVLRRDAGGLEVRLRESAASGYGESQANLTWGQSWSRGSLTLSGSFIKNGTLDVVERALTADQDFRRFGGQDRRYTFVNSPGTVYSLAGCPAAPANCFSPSIGSRANLPGLNSPFAGIPANQDGTGLTPADFVATAGIVNTQSSPNHFFSASEATSITLRGRFDLTPTIELFGDVLYTRRNTPPAEASLWLTRGTSGGIFTVPASNPYNPFGVPVGVNVGQPRTGNYYSYEPEYLQPTLGLRGGRSEWNWEVTSSLSRDLTHSVRLSTDQDAIAAALNSTDPATALNPFIGNGGSFASQAVIDGLFTRPPSHFRGDLIQTNAFIRGPLATLPAGKMQAVFGAEWNREKLEYFDAIVPTRLVAGTDDSYAAYTELRLPLIAGRGAGQANVPERLALSLALRADQSDRYDETGITDTIGLEFRPVPTLLLRTSYNSAFKPLSTYAAFRPLETSSGILIFDRLNNGYAITSMVSGGGVPDGIKPETSTSRTLGLLWTPRFLPGMQLSLTGWDNRLRDRIPTGGAQFFVDNEEFFPGHVIRTSSGSISQVIVTPVNIARTDMAGADFGLSWTLQTRYGVFSPMLAATWTNKFDVQVTPSSPVVSLVGSPGTDSGISYSTTSWSPRWKGAVSLGWLNGDNVSATINSRYVGAYLDPAAFATGPRAGTYQQLGDFWIADLNVELGVGNWLAPQNTWLSATRLSLGALNVFNKLPDFCNACLSGYDAQQYDIRGRFAYAELKFSF